MAICRAARIVFLLSVISCVVAPAMRATGVDASPIYVDFGDYRGAAAGLVDGTPVTWNVVPTINPFVPLALRNSSGCNTGIEISQMTGFDTGYDDTLNGGAWNVPGIPWSVGDATADNFATSGTGTVVFSNLSAPYYRVELISSRADSGTNRVANYLVNDTYADSGGPTGSQNFSASIHGWGNKSFMTWESVQPDANGQLTLNVVRTDGWGYVNAWKLQVADEVYIEDFSGSIGNLPRKGWAGKAQLTASSSVIDLPGGGMEARIAEANGYVYIYGNFTGDETAQAIFYTDAFPIDPALFDVTSFSWLMRNHNQATPIGGRVVVEIDGQWYATTETFVHTADGNTWAPQVFDFDRLPGTWSHLTFDSVIEVGSPLTYELPEDTITRFGLHFQTNHPDGWRAVRFTDFTVKAVIVPEPTTWMLLILSGIVASGCWPRYGSRRRV